MLRNKVLKGLTGIQNSSLMVMAQISNHLDIFIVYFHIHPLKSAPRADRDGALSQGGVQTAEQVSF